MPVKIATVESEPVVILPAITTAPTPEVMSVVASTYGKVLER